MRKAASQTERIKQSIIFAVIVTIFVSLFLTVVRSAYAWSTSQSAQSYCDTSTECVKIKVVFKNTEPLNSNMSMYVVARDEQTGASVTLGTVSPQQTKEGVIETNRTSISSGRVRFDLTWSNGQQGSDVRYASYNAADCQVASPIPTATPIPTSTPVVTPTPTVTPTQTPAVTPTATPTPTQTPVVTPDTSSTPRTDLTDNRSDGSRDSLDCVPESKSGRKECNPVVAGVSTTLPSTGILDDQVAIYAISAVMSFLLGMVMFQYVKLEEQSLRQ